jgi:potassium/hydrogen antiporter
MLDDLELFGLVLLAASAAVTLALLSNRVSQRVRIPAPAIFLIAAAVTSDLIPSLQTILPGPWSALSPSLW